MEIKPFAVEEWMNTYETEAEHNISETCVESLTVKELLELAGKGEDFFEDLLEVQLTYGHIKGSPEYREAVAALYTNKYRSNILATNGAAGANFLVFYSLVKSGDRIISVLPTYQQLYSIPESFGAEVKLLKLKPENNFLPDLDDLKSLINDKTKMICINNPNNPTGSLIKSDMLEKIVEIAKSCNAYVFCDEVYRGLNQQDISVPSIVDLYQKGISTGSMSKVFSLAGLRMGWIAAAEEVIGEIQKHRDYDTISCGVIDDILSVLVLKNCEEIMARNLKIVRDNLQILDNWVENEPAISYFKPEAGTTAFLKYDFDIPSVELCKGLLDKTGTLLVPGKAFEMEGFVRISFAGNTEELKLGLNKLSAYIKSLD